MNKGYIYGIGAAIITTIAGVLFAKRMKSNENEPNNLELAGVPDQLEKKKEDLEQLENAKMVSEGSQFGVQYYNEVKEDDKSIVTEKS